MFFFLSFFYFDVRLTDTSGGRAVILPFKKLQNLNANVSYVEGIDRKMMFKSFGRSPQFMPHTHTHTKWLWHQREWQCKCHVTSAFHSHQKWTRVIFHREHPPCIKYHSIIIFFSISIVYCRYPGPGRSKWILAHINFPLDFGPRKSYVSFLHVFDGKTFLFRIHLIGISGVWHSPLNASSFWFGNHFTWFHIRSRVLHVE